MKADAAAIMAALAKRYAPPSWALLSQVGSGTGWARGRYADALALGLWPSRGLDLHGFEVKAFRGDWLRELKRPEKADEIAVYCDFWWLVAAPGVIDLERDPIPQPWGVLVLNGRGLVQMRKPERNAKALPLDKDIVAAIFRRASEDMTPRSSIAEQIDAAREAGHESGKADAERGEGAATRDLARLRENVAAFESESGVRIDSYSGGSVGRLFRAAQNIEAARSTWRLRQARESLEAAITSVREAETAIAENGTEGTP